MLYDSARSCTASCLDPTILRMLTARRRKNMARRLKNGCEAHILSAIPCVSNVLWRQVCLQTRHARWLCRDGCPEILQEKASPTELWSILVQLLQCLQAEEALSVLFAAVVSKHIVANLRQLLPEHVHAQLQQEISTQSNTAGLDLTLWLQRTLGNPRVTRGLCTTLLGLVGLRAPMMPTVQDAWDSMLLRDDGPEVRKRRPYFTIHAQQHLVARVSLCLRGGRCINSDNFLTSAVGDALRSGSMPLDVCCANLSSRVMCRSVWWRSCPPARRGCLRTPLGSCCRRPHASPHYILVGRMLLNSVPPLR